MPVISAKLRASLCISASLLVPSGAVCIAQSTAPDVAATSSSLPDAPTPQNVTTSVPAAPKKPSSEDVTIPGLPRQFLYDQKAIWTSPLSIKPADLIWMLPLGATTGVLIGSDHHTMTEDIRINANDQHTFNTLSDAGVAALGSLPISMFLWSSMTHNAPQARETALLSGEALADSLVVNEVFKLVSRRDRPAVNDAQGDFFNSSPTDSSFPSNHAVAAWSMASVIGDEYPGWLTRTAVYGMAAGVSVSRVLAEQHFPSDVLIGSATGWLIGHYVYRTHHNFKLDPFDTTPMPGEYGAPRVHPISPDRLSPPPDPILHRPSVAMPLSDDVDPDTIGSAKVPMDSWIYPALERLGALGLIPGQSSSIRPWSRQECMRQLRVAEELVTRTDLYSAGLRREAGRLVKDLHDELDKPNYYASLDLESVYGRVGTIAGPTLADSYHFGQTWWNDMGRPLGRGTSAELGYETRAHYGRLYFYSREEIQHGPGNPAESQATNELINTLDRIQADDPIIQPIAERSAYNQARAIELYAGVAFAGNALSLGKQELYWGPTTMGPIAFSSNAEPTYSVRFESTRPHPLPLFPSLGTYRFDLVLGKLSGHSYPARPWYNGQKADFNFGDNLEISFTRWAVFWGEGHPITFHTFKQDVFSFSSTGGGTGGGGGSAGYGDRDDPGDRKSNFDFTYRLPFMSKLVTLYADAYSDDDPSPIDAPRRAVWNPGIYFARLPWLPHMDFRAEAVSSEGLAHDFGGQHFFINNQYLDSNTNKSFMLGNAVGRDGRAIEGRLGYWFSAKTRVEGGYRQNKGGTLFLPGGSTISDGFVNGSFAINSHWTAQVFTQYERFLIPSYMPGSQHNTSGWLQLTWNPGLGVHH